MNFKKALAFFLVFIVLAGYVYLVEFKQHNEKEAIKAVAQKVMAVSKDSVAAIQLKNTYGEFEIKHIQGEWRVTKPLYTEADENTITTMLSGLESAKKENELTVAESDFANFGLGEQAMSINLTFEDQQQSAILIGDKTPVGSNVFVSVSDSVVFTLAETVKNNFSKGLFELRNKKMLQFKQNDVQVLKLKNRSDQFTFRKATDDEWTIENINRPANRSKVTGILSKLENTNVKAFVDEEAANKKKYGIYRPAFEVELQLGPQQGSKKIRFSKKKDDKYYGFDEARKPIFEVDEAIIKDIELKLSDFRDTDFAKFQRSDVEKIELNYADTSLVLVKDDDDVWFTEDHSEKIQSGKISAFFSALDYCTISEFVKDGSFKPAKYGLNAAQLRIKLSEKTGVELLTAELGKFKGDNIYAKTGAYESVYLIPKSKLKDLKLKLDIIKEAPAVATGE